MKEEIKILTYALNHGFSFQVQYVDYEEGQWTAPVLLTPERYSKFMQDRSVKKVRVLYEIENEPLINYKSYELPKDKFNRI